MRQFYLDLPADTPPQPGQVVTLASDESHHLSTVLRGGRDLVLNLTDGRGRRYTARPAGGNRRRVDVEILTVTADPGESAAPRLHLACAVVKGKRFEWALEKAVEVGAHRIIPLVTEHGVIEPGSGRQERWLGILKAGLKQSGRCLLPELAEPLRLADHLNMSGGSWCCFGAVPGEVDSCRPWQEWLAAAPHPVPDSLEVIIGPEGGWSAAERDQLLARQVLPVDLGPHVLRTETAAVAGLLALQALRRAWGGTGAPS